MIKDLKSRAYDLLALIEKARAELQEINKKILKGSKKECASSTEKTKN